jgi:hypothetical protein
LYLWHELIFIFYRLSRTTFHDFCYAMFIKTSAM